MIRPLIIALLAGTAFLSVAGGPACAADSSATTLESNLAPEISADLIATYERTVKADPGFEPFQALYTRFETVRKWEAFLEAMKATGLKSDAGAIAAISAAVKSLAAHGITRASIASAAIAKLAGVGDWKAADQAQAELVIDELGTLLTEISDPHQRLQGQLVLAHVELQSDAPKAARIRVGTALRDLQRIDDPNQQFDYAKELVAIIVQLDDPQAVEIASEVVASVAIPEERAALVDHIAARLAEISAERLSAATPDDPLAFAWQFHVNRLTGQGADLATALAPLETLVDPLPAAIVVASGRDPVERQSICDRIVSDDIAKGHVMRAVNLRKMLPAQDCATTTALQIADALSASGLQNAALALIDDVLAAIDGQKASDLEVLRAPLAHALVETAALDRIDAKAGLLQQVFGKTDMIALRGRAGIVALLNLAATRTSAIPRTVSASVAGYAPTALMAALLSGNDRPGLAGAIKPTADDIALFERLGETLGARAAARPRLVDFIASDAPLAFRLALATGITASPGFHLKHDDALSAALLTLDETLGVTPHAPLSASLGRLDPANIAPDDPQRDALLLRRARASAWAGDTESALVIAKLSSNPEQVATAIAAITGVGEGFDAAVATIRSASSALDRVRAFRLLARTRADQLTGGTWLGAGNGASDGTPVRIVRAAAATGSATTVTRTGAVTVSISDAPTSSTPLPPLPGLDVDDGDVLAHIPYPVSGEGGIAVGGEGRFVRLARFESPSFDGQQNNGVRDYVYQQNATITPEFIFLNTGVFTLADTISAIGRSDVGAITLLPDGKVRINRPIAVGPDATLIISGTETPELQLNATLGSYLVNAGRLYIVNTRIVGFDTDKNAPAYVAAGESADRFRPFILSWSGSETNIAASELVALGYSAGRSYGISLTSGPPDDFFVRAETAAPTGTIVNNSFDNAYYGFYAYEAENVRVIGNEYRNSIIYGIDPHDRSHNLNLSLNTAYGTYKKHGIILSRDVDDSVILGNLTFDNHGSGIMLDRSSTGTVIAGNTVRNNAGDGVAVFESPCTLIGANDISANGRSGVLIRNSWDVGISQNIIGNNESAGIQGFISDLSNAKGSEGRNFEVDPYQPLTTLAIRSNAISGNGAGIQTAGVSAAELFDNRFRDQSKRLFGGNLDGLSAVLLQNSLKTPTLVSTSCTPVLTAPKACRLTPFGVLPTTSGTYRKGATGDYCLADAASPQAQAFHGVSP